MGETRQAPQAAPAAARTTQPRGQAPTAAPQTDLGISQDEEITALVRQGYSMEQARQFASEAETASSGPVAGDVRIFRQDLAPEDTPEQLRAKGYQLGADGVWRITRQEQAPAAPAGPQQSEGYNTARMQEEARAKLLADNGQGIGLTDQFTAPFNDELAGAAGYLTQGIGNLGRRLMGRDIEVSAMERARAAADVRRDGQDAFARENPFQAAGGQIVGGFAMAPARAAGAMTGAQNFLRTSQAFARPTVGQGYRAAAGVGGAYGLADAEGGLGGRALGAATGAGLGVATAGLIDGGANAIGGLFNRGPRVPRAEARVGQVLSRELRANKIDPQAFLASLNGAPAGALPINASDGLLAPVAEALVATTGPGGRTVRQAVEAQRQAAPDRIRNRIGNEMGGQGDYFATLNNSIETRRQAASQVIDQIGPQQFRPGPDAVRALRSDYARQALEAQANLKVNSPDPVTRDQGIRLQAVVRSLASDVNPNVALDVRTAQDASRALLDASSDAWRSGNGGLGGLLGDIGKAVRNDARTQVGAYDDWLTRYGDESSQIEALELGRRIFRNADDPAADGMSAEVLRGQFAEMSDTAKDMFRKGIAEAVVARTRTGKGEVGTMRDLLRTQEFGDRVRLAFPDEQAFTRFMNAAEAEVNLANMGQGITGNSNTARRQATMKRLGVQQESQLADQLSQTTMTGIPLVAGRAALRAGGRAVGRRNSVLENDEINAMMGRALTDEQVLRQMLQRPARRGLFSGRIPAGLAGSVPQTLPGF